MFRCKVSQAAGRPIISLDRDRDPSLAEGEVRLRIDNEVYEANFVKTALNVVRRPGDERNVLPDISGAGSVPLLASRAQRTRFLFRRVGAEWDVGATLYQQAASKATRPVP